MLAGLDGPYLACWMLCVFAFIAFVVWVKSVDYSHLENRRDLKSLPPRVLRIILPPRPPAAGKPPGAKPGQALASKGAPEDRAPRDLADRIQRARRSVQENVEKAQERITKAAVLSILTGKGPKRGKALSGGKLKEAGFGDWEDLHRKLQTLEGLTRYDAKQGSQNRDGRNATREDSASASTLAGLAKGFQSARTGAMKKIGSLRVEKPQLLAGSKHSGSRSAEAVSAFITRMQASVTMLYEERLKINPSLEGKVTVIIVIEEDGRVSSARIVPGETTLRDEAFHAALIRRIRHWVFPSAKGGPVEMKSPFVFRPA